MLERTRKILFAGAVCASLALAPEIQAHSLGASPMHGMMGGHMHGLPGFRGGHHHDHFGHFGPFGHFHGRGMGAGWAFGWPYGWGGDYGGYGYPNAEPQPSPAPTTPAIVRVEESAPCPADFQWDPALGRATRINYC